MYDLTRDEIVEWALHYAGYDELEEVAKAIYSIYVQRRKEEQPESHKINRNYRNKQYRK